MLLAGLCSVHPLNLSRLACIEEEMVYQLSALICISQFDMLELDLMFHLLDLFPPCYLIKWQRFSPSFVAKTRDDSQPGIPLSSQSVTRRNCSSNANVACGKCEIPCVVRERVGEPAL